MFASRILIAAIAVGALAGWGSAATPPAQRTAATSPAITKVLVFVLENHSLAQSEKSMPFTTALSRQYAYATDYTAIRHPSLPNYLSMAGGQTFGVTDDGAPSVHRLDGRSVFGQAIANGRTAGIYAESMKSNCQQVNGSRNGYAVRHNPWAYFVGERRFCDRYDVPLEPSFATAVVKGTLPNVGMVIPNLCDDAHNCPLSTTDAWYSTELPRVMAGRDFTSGRLAIVLTADENDDSPGNVVSTIVIHEGTLGEVVTSPLNHYSIARLFEDVVGAPHLANAATAHSLSAAFGLTLSR